MKDPNRREFIKQSSLIVTSLALPFNFLTFLESDKKIKKFDVIIIGGSYSGLASAMALGRALRKVLIIDNGKPCNRQTPHSHNFLGQDGRTPEQITTIAKKQVSNYDTVYFFKGIAIDGKKSENKFEIKTASGDAFYADKLIFATGIKDIMPKIKNFSKCWGISILHCPYCHGYEVRDTNTGILGNGEYGFKFSKLISNWTKNITLFTNGKSLLTNEQSEILKKHKIHIIEKEIEKFEHINGYIQNIIFKDNSNTEITAIYTKTPFEQNCSIPEKLGCELTDEGYLKVDDLQKTNMPNIYACGDNTTRMRTIANAVSMGTTAGMMLNKEFVFERF
ncbi:NAD(P)/FAD-dependent oxidoreductase [Kordia algicida OT-1]|uniref:Alkyl hydroperoxide reductase, F52a subunit n=1 Tax=Kordia algicida OT-1 TaxID=391587 RepID=A9CU17_9FLAO|nr:NAD(P)/FAD-dependent oxidoreductase [Kordia algicida]EDP94170.1 alkyl hydroperoxide reductase, F52a subunit [Kordia algicida OT-1]